MMDEPFGEQKQRKNLFRRFSLYLGLHGGSLDHAPSSRYIATVVQGVMMMLFSFLAMNVRYWLDTEGVMYLFWLLFVLASFVGLVFYHYAFYLTMRDNLPRMVKTKNSVWLFLFTLYYFEIAVLAGLFWFLYIVLSLSGTALCRGLLCQGNISAVIFFANSTTAVLTYVLIRSRKLLGIPLLDAFGI